MKRALLDGTGRFLARLSPELASRYWYLYCFRKPLSLSHPRAFNEKLMWLKLKLYSKDPRVTQCADKYRVREYIEQAGYGHILNTFLGVWDRAEDIPWDQLPESFVLKCNHGCGYNLLCQDKAALDIPAAVKQLDAWMHTEFWLNMAEIQYRRIPKKIIGEAFLGDGTGLVDYKFYCFHGKAQYTLACTQRETGTAKYYFFDKDWNFCPLNQDGLQAPPGFTLPKPDNFQQMLRCAEDLAEPFPFVRIDLYNVDGRIVFGEMTFIPSGALGTSRPPETEGMFGDMIHLPL